MAELTFDPARPSFRIETSSGSTLVILREGKSVRIEIGETGVVLEMTAAEARDLSKALAHYGAEKK